MPGEGQAAASEWRLFAPIKTFTGLAGAGAIGTFIAGTVTGAIEISAIYMKCSTSLVGAGTLAFGIAVNTGQWDTTTDATEIDANEWWVANDSWVANFGNDMSLGVPIAVAANLIWTIGVADITAGVLVPHVIWRPFGIGTLT